MKPVTLVFLLSGSVLAVAHYLAIGLYLYWRYEWLDIPMHLLGGAVVALGVFALSGLRGIARFRRLGAIAALVLFFAVSWEVFQYALGWSVFKEDFWLDTITDVVVSLAGGALGYAVAKRLDELNDL